MANYPSDPISDEQYSKWRFDGTYQGRQLAILDLIRIATQAFGGGGYDFDLLNQEATQELIRLLLVDLESKDFATENTLALIKSKTDNLDVTLSSRNLEATQLLIKTAIDTLNLKDFATQTTLLTRLSKADFEARINTLGQKTMANSTPVVLASDQSPIPITGNVTSANFEDKLLQVDSVGSTTYIGYANAGTLTSVATWAIKKIVETGSDVVITWADGNTTFDNIWNDRLILTYS